MRRKQFTFAACLVFLIAVVGLRFVATSSNVQIDASTFSIEDATPAQNLLLGKTIDINTADERTLEVLPYIGPKLAARIVKDRNINGPFRSVHDLARVYGIGRATIERNLPFIAVK